MFDSDRVIEERTGADIPWIFDMEGEAGFRRREQEAIDELTRQDGIVLATGGGVVVTPENRDMLHERGCVVYLRASAETLLARVGGAGSRPLLAGLDEDARRDRLVRMLAEREGAYATARIVVDTDGQPPEAVAERIRLALGGTS